MDVAPLSILIPLHRSLRFLDVAARNIESLHPRFHLVISDATVEDDALARLQAMHGDKPGILWLGKRELGCGWVNHYNDLRDRAPTPYFAWLAHDDEAGCDYYAACLAALESDRRLFGAVGRCEPVRGAGLRNVAQRLVADIRGLSGGSPSAEELLLKWNLGILFRAVFRKSMTVPIEHTTHGDEWADIIWAYGLCLENRFMQVPDVVYHKRYYGDSTHAGWRRGSVRLFFRHLVAEAARTPARWASIDFDTLLDAASTQSAARASRPRAILESARNRCRTWLATVLLHAVTVGRRRAAVGDAAPRHA